MPTAPFSIINLFDLEAPYVTEYRRLLYRIMNKESQAETKSIMVTSAMSAEGKSTVCSFMALTAAVKKELRTLILDADLRRPSIHMLFGVSLEPGLVEVLLDAVAPRNVIKKTSIDNLDIMPSGRLSNNPTEIFDADAIGNMIEELKFYYDLIMVDCAPLLPVSDPMMLAPHVDGTLLVVKAGATQKELVERAVGILNQAQNNILGVVLNNMNRTLPYYYDYDYYHYDYRQSPSKKIEAHKKAMDSARKADRAHKDNPTTKGKIGHN